MSPSTPSRIFAGSTISPTLCCRCAAGRSTGASCATSARSASSRRSSTAGRSHVSLEEGNSYLEIVDRVRTSTATVTRVAHWLRHGAGGYEIALERGRSAKGAAR